MVHKRVKLPNVSKISRLLSPLAIFLRFQAFQRYMISDVVFSWKVDSNIGHFATKLHVVYVSGDLLTLHGYSTNRCTCRRHDHYRISLANKRHNLTCSNTSKWPCWYYMVLFFPSTIFLASGMEIFCSVKKFLIFCFFHTGQSFEKAVFLQFDRVIARGVIVVWLTTSTADFIPLTISLWCPKRWQLKCEARITGPWPFQNPSSWFPVELKIWR